MKKNLIASQRNFVHCIFSPTDSCGKFHKNSTFTELYQGKHINLAWLDPNASAHNSFIIGKIAFGNLGNVLAVKGIFILFLKQNLTFQKLK